jgi:hypothetical protein
MTRLFILARERQHHLSFWSGLRTFRTKCFTWNLLCYNWDCIDEGTRDALKSDVKSV